jgi:hypothetical protein
MSEAVEMAEAALAAKGMANTASSAFISAVRKL